MSSTFMHQILQTIEDGVNSRPSAIEFEMAYQARIAIDRIKFAIRQFEKVSQTDSAREANIQLLDALDRLQAADRRFQFRWRQRTDERHANGKAS